MTTLMPRSGGSTYWLDTPDGPVALELALGPNDPSSVGRGHLKPGDRVWRACLHHGDIQNPDSSTWLATLSVQRPAAIATAWSFEWQVASAGADLPEFRARTPEGDGVAVTVWTGRRGRWEARHLRSEGPQTRSPLHSTITCLEPDCAAPVIARCSQCGRSFCSTHGQAAAPLPARCSACLVSAASIVAGLAVAIGEPNRAHDVLRPWTEAPGSSPVLKHVHGLLCAEAGDFDQAGRWMSADGEDAAALAQVHLRRGAGLLAKDEPLAAAQALNAALRHDAQLEPARQALAQLKAYETLDHMTAGRVAEAIAAWEGEFAQEPLEPLTVHDVGIVHYWAASRLEGQPPIAGASHPAEPYWRKTIACWAAVVTSPVFWQVWRRQRKTDAGLDYGDEDIAEVGRAITDRFVHEFRDLQSDYAAAGRPDDARRAAEYEVLWLLELRSAELLVRFPILNGVPGWPSDWVCGPLMLDELLTQAAAKPLAMALRRAILSITDPAGQSLRQYFSPMGRYHLLMQENRLDQAIAELTNAAAVWPEAKRLLSQALLSKADEWAQVHHYEDALSLYHRARVQGADLSGHEATLRDICLKRLKELREGDSDFEVMSQMMEGAILLAPSQTELRSQLANVYNDWGRQLNNRDDFEGGVTQIRKALQHAPNEAPIRHSARVALANLAISIHQHDVARTIELLKEALTWESDDDTSNMLSSILFTRALDLARAGKSKEAILAMVDEIRYDTKPQDRATESDARRRIGQALLARASTEADANRMKDAVALAQDARRYHDDSKTRRVLAAILFRAGQLDESLGILKQEFKSAPNDAQLRENIGSVLVAKAMGAAKRDQIAKAIDAFKEAYSYDPDPQYRDNLIALYMKVERFAEAITLARESLAQDPANAQKRRTLATAIHNSGMQLINRKEFDSAINAFKQALQVESDDVTRKMLAQAYLGRAVAKFERGDRYGAKSDLAEALKYDPQNANIRNNYNRL